MSPPSTRGGLAGPRRRWLGLGVFALALVGTVFAAARLGRRPGPAPGESPHAHAAPAASPMDTLRSVRLSAVEQRRIGVTLAEVTLGPIEREIRVVAQVTYDERRVGTIAPRIDGWVSKLYVNTTGQAVRRGEPLFAIYSPMVVTAQQELLLARRLASRVGQGAADARAGATGLIDAARQRLLAWDVPPDEIAQVEESGQVRQTVTLRAPFAGVVVDKAVVQGQRVMAGDRLYRIADVSRVWLEGEVFERDLPAVQVGQQVRAELPALPGESRTGRIDYIYPALDPTTRTARIRVELSNPTLALKPGMYATVRFTKRTPAVLSAPRSAVLVTGERALAFLKRPDGSFEPREVSVGLGTDERLEILSGLARGDTVVASATFLVDAESNLGTSLGGMGNMPGMDIRAPAESTAPERGQER